MQKCECYIHSLKQDGKNHLGEATIIRRLGDNDYLAEYRVCAAMRSLTRLQDGTLWTMCTASSPRYRSRGWSGNSPHLENRLETAERKEK